MGRYSLSTGKVYGIQTGDTPTIAENKKRQEKQVKRKTRKGKKQKVSKGKKKHSKRSKARKYFDKSFRSRNRLRKGMTRHDQGVYNAWKYALQFANAPIEYKEQTPYKKQP